MINKLERWVWVGGAALACIAGMVNAIGLLSNDHQPVTHMTGPTTSFALALINGDAAAVLRIGMVMISFVLGAVASGFIIRHSELKLGRRYGGVLALESALLFVAAFILPLHVDIGCACAAAAAGLQNAMASSYSGTIMRTTHLTGMFNDLGASLGHWIRGIDVDIRRIKLCFMVIIAFFAGAVLGTLLYKSLGYHTLYIPATLTGGVAIAYTTYSHLQKKKINLLTMSLTDVLERLHPGFGPRDDESSR